ncbi:hypothetical protein QGM71_07645 [Virgibacillus sp. C22-A2]|uniref:Uncharacterized protein n=1 Tax=Virgibacillus tibetensis TaxID=3042313 RepID=A0ABU6KE05_9BACI|nr:hypothetical protein [Virgibacillus sp. C22-A2]
MAYINEQMVISSPYLESVVIKQLMKEGEMKLSKASRPNELKYLYHYQFIES